MRLGNSNNNKTMDNPEIVESPLTVNSDWRQKKVLQQEEFLRLLLIIIIPLALVLTAYNTIIQFHNYTLSLFMLLITLSSTIIMMIAYYLNKNNHHKLAAIITLIVFELGALASLLAIPFVAYVLFDYLLIPVVLSIILFSFQISFGIMTVNTIILIILNRTIYQSYAVEITGSIQFQLMMFAMLYLSYFINRRIEKDQREILLQKEKKINQKNKLEAIGQIVEGVAHDFNNLLTGILSNAELLLISSGNIDEYHKNINTIKNSGLRASSLIKKLLSFSSGEVSDSKIISINKVLQDLTEVISRTFPKNIDIQLVPPLYEIHIEGNDAQLYNALLNICINARDAMLNGGTLEIKFKKTEEYPPEIRILPGGYLKITISDTGKGIERKFMDKIFDPYFTTKSENKGVGLGLSSVYGTIRDLQGYIQVESEVSLGTLFTIYLPIKYPNGKPKYQKENSYINLNKKSILIIDDDPIVLESIKMSLEQIGHFVTCVNDGMTGINYIKENNEDLDMVLLDLNMPKMNGLEVYSQIRKLIDLPVIAITGYINHEDVQKLNSMGINGILNKPFTRESLIDMIDNEG